MTSITARRALWGAGLSILLSAAGGGAILFGAPHLKADAATDISAPPPAVPVSVAKAESRRIVSWEEFSGRLEAIDRIQQATGGLEERVKDIDQQEAALCQVELKLIELTDHLLAANRAITEDAPPPPDSVYVQSLLGIFV